MDEKEEILNEEITDEKPATVPFYVYESEITRAEIRLNDEKQRNDMRFRRLVAALIIAIIAVVVSNGAWLLYESMYDTINYSQDGSGLNNINTGTQGDLNGAEGESKDAAEQK